MKKNFEYYLKETGEVGFVDEAVSSVVKIRGLPGAKLTEMIILEDGQLGQVMSISETAVEALVFGEERILVGSKAVRVGRPLTVGVGDWLLGTTVDGLGRIVSGQPAGENPGIGYLVDVPPSGIATRRKITRPLETGVVVVDLLVPLGKGQRELFIGDRKTGKSVATLTTMLAQARQGVICVYCAIGKQKADIKRIEQYVSATGITSRVVIVASSAKDALGEIYTTPFTAMAVAEYFRDSGRESLIILDDLTTHAKYYRELSLVLRRFPGRDAYPGDVFHVHSKLLERAGNFEVGNREVPITALPVAETVQGDISGYIPTNLMSMTDGHVYFDAELFFKGRRPAVDPFVSVTRVGFQTQTPLLRELTREIVNLLSQYERTQGFLRFGAELGESSRQILNIGNKLLAFFDQPLLSVVPRELQIVMMGLLWAGAWNGKGLGEVLNWYQGNEAVRGEVAQIVGSSASLNQLVANVRQKAELFGRQITR